MWFERRCQACGVTGPAVCPACLAGLVAVPVGGSATTVEADLDRCCALFAFEGTGRDLVVALKYRNARHLGRLLGPAMADLVDPTGIDVVTWAPTSRRRRADRGYDQSRLLARSVARALGRPCRSLLRRAPGPTQTGRTLAQRQAGPRFVARHPCPPGVLVVDDVVTTGATLAAAGRALRDHGAQRVTALTAARTPRLGGGAPGGRSGSVRVPPTAQGQVGRRRE
jgi:predicted amidophosphoribosyltransferase